jgi:hypothetical protein
MRRSRIKPRVILPSYLFAMPPSSWIERWLCRLIDAKTIHWGMIISTVDYRHVDYIVSESVPKGTIISRLGNRHSYIYEIKGMPDINPMEIVNIHSEYGEWPYDWAVGLWTAIWWISRHLLSSVLFPIIKDKTVNCQEWIVLLASELGSMHGVDIKLIPDDEYPMCVNLEHSKYLHYVGEINISKGGK